MTQHTHAEWLDFLQCRGEWSSQALEDLRCMILDGLPHALRGKIPLDSPDFRTMADMVAQHKLIHVQEHLSYYYVKSTSTTCVHKLALRHDYQEFVARNTEVIVVGPEGRDAFAEYWREHSLPSIGLPDLKAVVLKRYGQEVNLFILGRIPAQVIVDKRGIVRYAHFGHAMSDMPDNCELLALIDELNQEASTNGAVETSVEIGFSHRTIRV